MSNIVIAIVLTALAGMATLIGTVIVFLGKKEQGISFHIMLGFAAGVMLYVAFVGIFLEAREAFSEHLGEKNGALLTIVIFLASMTLMAVLEKVLPGGEHEHNFENVVCSNEKESQQLKRTGIMIASASVIHNIPEGMAAFIAALQDPVIAISVIGAIALHNIPLGFAISAPIYIGTGSKKKALLYAFIAGVSEPIGAVIGYLLFMPILTSQLYGVLLASVAGVMVYIASGELIPAAKGQCGHSHSTYGLIGGLGVMAISMWIFM